MGEATRQIIALGGGGFSLGPTNRLLDDYALSACANANPRICFLPTASGDADHYIVKFYRAFSPRSCRPSHVSLFRRDMGVKDLRAHLLAQDLIYVGGGSILSLLGVWRAHGVDAMLREAWEDGAVLCGQSAGSLCWFERALTSFHGTDRAVEGLGFLPGSNAVHYDDEPGRRPAFHQALRERRLPAGYAASDGTALHFAGRRLHRVVASEPDSAAYRVALRGRRVVEHTLEIERLGAVSVAV